MEKFHGLIAVTTSAGIGAYFLMRAAGWESGREVPLQIICVLGGVPLVISVARRLLKRDVGSDFLGALSILTSALMGQWLVAAIMVLMLSGGGALEDFISRHAANVLSALAKRMPQKAHVKRGSELRDAPLADVAPGDVVIVFPHELCPVDGIVVEGQGWMDESYLTGEPFMLPKAPGASVLSGAINGTGALTIEAKKLARDSRYAQIMRVMEDSIQSRPRIRRLGDQIAAWYVPVVLLTAAGAWAATGDSLRALAVLVTATPCPLIIAIPVAIMGAVSVAAKAGIVIRDPSVLEQIPRCRTAIFDKTGTLTYGKPSMTSLVRADGASESEILEKTAAVERYSRHPLAGAIVEAATARSVNIPQASEVHELPGAGIEGVVAGTRVRIVGRGQAERSGFRVPPGAGGLESVAIIDGRIAALLRFRDAPQAESRKFVAHLPRLHQFEKILLLSGDRESEVKYLADEVGISDAKYECTPEEKVSTVARETARAATMFVGDGINDAPALMRATVGVAIGTASDITSAAAGAVVLTPSIGKVDELIHIGKRMRAIALESAALGMALSLAAMAAAAAGLMTPIEGAIVQEAVDLAAILNAARSALPGRKTDF